MSENTTIERIHRGGPKLTVGLLTADLLKIGDEVRLLEDAGVELLHIDVMDGVFCPMMTVGPPVIQAIRTTLLKDIHLMVVDPLAKIDAFVAAGADILTFHIEGAAQPLRVLQALRSSGNVNEPDRGLIRGIAINPSTAIEAVEPLLDEVDYVLILAINPGWTGQTFLPATRRRLQRMRELIDSSGRRILLGVDGGVSRDNIDDVAALPVDVVVSGSAVFDGKEPRENAAFMLERMARR